MRRSLLAAAAALSLAVGLSPAAEAKTFCQKAASGKQVLKKTGGVTVFREGRTLLSACSDAKRKSSTLYGMDPGYKFSKVAVANKRCLAILVTSAKGLPQLVFKDLGEGGNSSNINTIAYGAVSATVTSLSMTTNCAAVWGESSSDGTTTSYRIQARPVSSANSLPRGQVTTVATVAAADDLAKVKATAAGKQVKVSWTLAGAPQSAVVG